MISHEGKLEVWITGGVLPSLGSEVKGTEDVDADPHTILQQRFLVALHLAQQLDELQPVRRGEERRREGKREERDERL